MVALVFLCMFVCCMCVVFWLLEIVRSIVCLFVDSFAFLFVCWYTLLFVCSFVHSFLPSFLPLLLLLLLLFICVLRVVCLPVSMCSVVGYAGLVVWCFCRCVCCCLFLCLCFCSRVCFCLFVLFVWLAACFCFPAVSFGLFLLPPMHVCSFASLLACFS